MSSLSSCPRCDREALDSAFSNFFPVHTCRECGRNIAMIAVMEMEQFVRSVALQTIRITTRSIRVNLKNLNLICLILTN